MNNEERLWQLYELDQGRYGRTTIPTPPGYIKYVSWYLKQHNLYLVCNKCGEHECRGLSGNHHATAPCRRCASTARSNRLKQSDASRRIDQYWEAYCRNQCRPGRQCQVLPVNYSKNAKLEIQKRQLIVICNICHLNECCGMNYAHPHPAPCRQCGRRQSQNKSNITRRVENYRLRAERREQWKKEYYRDVEKTRAYHRRASQKARKRSQSIALLALRRELISLTKTIGEKNVDSNKNATR